MILLALLAACGRERYDVADLQLDVADPLPADAETLRLCVSGHGTLETGAGNGRAAFTGIRAQTDGGDSRIAVAVDVLDADGALIGAVAPVELTVAAPYATAPLGLADAPCTDDGGRAAEGEDSLLLAVRFEE